MGERMHTLTLDPSAIIVSTGSGLRVYSAQGTTELRSKNLVRVHAILSEHLVGHYTEKALLAAAPSTQGATILKYLRALRRAGAIRIASNSAVPQHGRRSRQEPGFLVNAYERGQRRGVEKASIRYLKCRELSALLVGKIQTSPIATRQVYVLNDESPARGAGLLEGNSDRQDIYTRWLLGRRFAENAKRAIEIFQIDGSTGGLSRKAVLRGRNLSSNRDVPQALELVCAADVEQAPLAICQVNPMFCSVKLKRFGIDYTRVGDEMLRDVLASMSIEHADANLHIRWMRTPMAMNSVSEPTLPRVIDTGDYLVAASFNSLRLRLLERFLSQKRSTSVAADRCNLVQPWHFPDMDYLADVLRQRSERLDAQIKIRADGLYSCEYADLCTSSLLRDKALRDLMILLTWRTYYGHGDKAYSAAHECDYSRISSPGQIWRLLSLSAERCRVELAEKYLTYAKLSCWGKTAWVGVLDG